jgi:hypothetical protein
MLTTRLLPFSMAFTLAVSVLVGCSPNVVQVHGVLHKDGKTYEMVQDEQVSISFANIGPKGVPFLDSTRVKKDGTFFLGGPAGRGIPPGKYKVAIGSKIYGPRGEGQGDRFDDEFAEDKTPLSYEVTAAAKQEIFVDIGKKTVTPK